MLFKFMVRIGHFFNDWVNHSYEAWVKAGRPDSF